MKLYKKLPRKFPTKYAETPRRGENLKQREAA